MQHNESRKIMQKSGGIEKLRGGKKPWRREEREFCVSKLRRVHVHNLFDDPKPHLIRKNFRLIITTSSN
jgi:hypothetical protein